MCCRQIYKYIQDLKKACTDIFSGIGYQSVNIFNFKSHHFQKSLKYW